MRVVYKYVVDVADTVTVQMPHGAELLHLDMQMGLPCIWALVDTDQKEVPHQFAWRGTGHDCSGLRADQHVGTVLLHSGRLVFHLFDLGEP